MINTSKSIKTLYKISLRHFRSLSQQMILGFEMRASLRMAKAKFLARSGRPGDDGGIARADNNVAPVRGPSLFIRGPSPVNQLTSFPSAIAALRQLLDA